MSRMETVAMIKTSIKSWGYASTYPILPTPKGTPDMCRYVCVVTQSEIVASVQSGIRNGSEVRRALYHKYVVDTIIVGAVYSIRR